MSTEDYLRLKDDLDKNGYDINYPIWFYEGQILDGWNREKACKELGMEPTYAEFTGSYMDAIEFVMRSNKRRNLTSSQWAAVAVEADGIIEAIRKEARERQRANLMQGNKSPDTQLIVERENRTANETASKVASLFNTNRTYINEAQRLKDEKPELFEAVKRGEKTITEVKKEEKIEDRKKQIEFIKQKIENENLTIKGEYDVIAIDPPWAYEEKGGLSTLDYDPDVTRGGCPYPTMTVSEISKIHLPLKNNAVVYLWTTHAFLKDAFDLLIGWGLVYKATIVWDKEIMGMGRTIRMQCEFCLIATKGSPVIQGNSERDIIREKRREHSRKPEAFYLMVERMTIGSRLDYFAREQREKWEVYGAETGKF